MVGMQMRVLLGGQQKGVVDWDWQDVMVERNAEVEGGNVEIHSELMVLAGWVVWEIGEVVYLRSYSSCL